MREAETHIRVMTWNIHGGIGTDGVRDLPRIVARVRAHEPDIVALQEVDSRGRGAGEEPAFEMLARSLGRHTAEARLMTAPDGDYGHVLISRWPIVDPARHDITLPGREPRAAIEATVATPLGPLHVVAAHLGLSVRERQKQAQRLAAISAAGPACSVTLGDFNDWVWHGSVQRALSDLMPARTRHKTFPSRLPLLALDRIYARPADALQRSWTDPAAQSASDHLPLVADLRIPGPDCR